MSEPDLTHVALDPATCVRVDQALTVLGRSRFGAVLSAAFAGATRYRDFVAAVPGVSHAVLAARLRELVTLGLLAHEEGCYTPLPRAAALKPTLDALAALVDSHPDLFTP